MGRSSLRRIGAVRPPRGRAVRRVVRSAVGTRPQEAGLIESGPPVDAARPFDAGSRDGDVVPDATTIEATDGGASASPEASTNDAGAEDAGEGDAGGRDAGCILKACAQLGSPWT